MAAVTLSRREVRQLALGAQRLIGPRSKSALALLGELGAVQLDTISVLARSHLLVAWSRLGPLDRERVEAAYWNASSPTSFEYWMHAACIIPMERWPAFALRRRKYRARGRRWHRLQDEQRSIAYVRDRLASEGPLTASELGGAKKGGVWWDWTEEKIAVEWLLDIGEVVCVERRGWRRVYDLAERAVPSRLLSIDLDDEACRRVLVAEAARVLGVATARDLSRHHGLTLADIAPVLRDGELVEVAVEGSDRRWYTTEEALEGLGRRAAARATLLSPFDSLVWDRDRTERVFGFVHRLEAYTPKSERVHGYYAMPILSGTELLGKVDPGRAGSSFVAKHVVLERSNALGPAARALVDAACWIGASSIRLERVTPEALGLALSGALAAAGADVVLGTT